MIYKIAFSVLFVGSLFASEVMTCSEPSSPALFTADFLFWGAGIDGSDLAVSGKVGNVGIQRDLVGMDGKMEPGVRAALGYRFGSFDEWEFSGVWTYYHGRSGTVTDTTGAGTIMRQSWFTALGPEVLHAKGHWNLNLNVADLKLAKTYAISTKIKASPYVAARGAFSGFSLMGSYASQWVAENAAHVQSFFQGNTSFTAKSNYLAGGLLAGTGLLWSFDQNWGLLGDFGVSLLYGQFKVKERFHVLDLIPDAASDPVLAPSNLTYLDDFSRVRATLDLLLGLQWKSAFRSEKVKISFFAGYELYQWFGLNQLFTVARSNDSYAINAELSAAHYNFSVDNQNGDIGLQGLTARFNIEF